MLLIIPAQMLWSKKRISYKSYYIVLRCSDRLKCEIITGPAIQENGHSGLILVAIVFWIKELAEYLDQQEADFLLGSRDS